MRALLNLRGLMCLDVGMRSTCSILVRVKILWSKITISKPCSCNRSLTSIIPRACRWSGAVLADNTDVSSRADLDRPENWRSDVSTGSETGRLFLKIESETFTDKVFTGREVMWLDEAHSVSAQKCNIQTPASIKARPAGQSSSVISLLVCQLCWGHSCLIAVHHFWGPLWKGEKSMSFMLRLQTEESSITLPAPLSVSEQSVDRNQTPVQSGNILNCVLESN